MGGAKKPPLSGEVARRNAGTERVRQICDDLSVSFADSSPERGAFGVRLFLDCLDKRGFVFGFEEGAAGDEDVGAGGGAEPGGPGVDAAVDL